MLWTVMGVWHASLQRLAAGFCSPLRIGGEPATVASPRWDRTWRQGCPPDSRKSRLCVCHMLLGRQFGVTGLSQAHKAHPTFAGVEVGRWRVLDQVLNFTSLKCYFKKNRLFKKRIGCRDHTRPIGPTAFTTRLFMENVCRKRRGEVCAVCWGQEARPGRPAGGQTVPPPPDVTLLIPEPMAVTING